MTRRDCLLATSVLVATPLRALAQAITPKTIDPRFVRLWTDAQRERPSTILSVARIAPEGEPGTALTIRGQVFSENGRGPLPHAVVFAYHTDATGAYNRPGVSGWRLKGWAMTDAEGRFTFETIRPAPYPSHREAAHVHLSVEGAGVRRQTLEDVLFADDPLLSAAQRERSQAAGRFSNIVPATVRDGRQECAIIFRPTGEFVF